jgi:hypothetical protein
LPDQFQLNGTVCTARMSVAGRAAAPATATTTAVRAGRATNAVTSSLDKSHKGKSYKDKSSSNKGKAKGRGKAKG